MSIYAIDWVKRTEEKPLTHITSNGLGFFSWNMLWSGNVFCFLSIVTNKTETKKEEKKRQNNGVRNQFRSIYYADQHNKHFTKLKPSIWHFLIAMEWRVFRFFRLKNGLRRSYYGFVTFSILSLYLLLLPVFRFALLLPYCIVFFPNYIIFGRCVYDKIDQWIDIISFSTSILFVQTL